MRSFAPTPTKKEATRARIVAAASRLLRAKGYDGVGVADVMREAGLTHGGFYAHFASREALLVEAVGRAGLEAATALAGAIAAGPGRSAAFRALVDGYLSDAHLASAAGGCPVAALVAEMPRQPDAVRHASTARVRAFVAGIERALPPDADRGEAPVIAGTLVGALQIARALGGDAGRRVLAAARASLVARYAPD